VTRRRAYNSAVTLQTGMRVRVKAHVMDPGYPDLPLGGWRGRIVECPEHPNHPYLVRWSRETLKHIHPVYRQRCDQDDVCFDQAWLMEGDLEPDPGGPLSLEHPPMISVDTQAACPC